MKKEALKFLEILVNTPSPFGHEVRGQRIWLDYVTKPGMMLTAIRLRSLTREVGLVSCWQPTQMRLRYQSTT